MKSRIFLDVDTSGQPEIVIEQSNSNDIRDKTLSILMEQINYPNGYNKVNKYHNIPQKIFVVKEHFNNLYLGEDCKAPIDDKFEKYTLVPLNRVKYDPDRWKVLDPDVEEWRAYSIWQAVDRIRNLYEMLGMDTEDVDYIEKILNAVPDLQNELHNFTCVEYPESKKVILANIKGNKSIMDEKNYVLSEIGKISVKEFEDKFLK